MKRKIIRIAGAALMSAILIMGCGSKNGNMAVSNDTAKFDAGGGDYNSMSYDMTAAVAEEAYEMEYAGGPSVAQAEPLSENLQQDQRKLIKTVDLEVETESYDTLMASLENQVVELGGYIEYQYQYNGSSYSDYVVNRHASMQIRIPVKRLDEFVVKVGEQSNITGKEERVEDVTLRYVDLESHKKALTTEQDRLLDLLEIAETVEDIITIEQRLSEVRYQLESMESQLRTLDNRIDYSTINLQIQEVKRLTPTEEKTVWSKIRNGFSMSVYNIGNGLVDFFIWFVVSIPYIVIWAVVILAVFLIIRGIIKKKRRKRGEKCGNGTEEDRGTGTDKVAEVENRIMPGAVKYGAETDKRAEAGAGGAEGTK